MRQQERVMLPPSWRPRGARGPRYELRHLFVPLTLLVPLVLLVSTDLPRGVVVGVAIGSLLLQGGLWWLARQRWRRLQQDFGLLVHRNRLDEMGRRLLDDALVRLFTPPSELLPKVGLFHLLSGDPRKAELALEEAWLASEPAEQVALLGPLCRVKYQLGHFGDLKELAEEWVPRERFGSSAKLYLAAGLVEWAEPDWARARALIADAHPQDPEEEQVLHRVRERLSGR